MPFSTPEGALQTSSYLTGGSLSQTNFCGPESGTHFTPFGRAQRRPGESRTRTPDLLTPLDHDATEPIYIHSIPLLLEIDLFHDVFMCEFGGRSK